MIPNHNDGAINYHLAGKRIYAAMKDGDSLQLQIADASGNPTGQFVKIGWVDANGVTLKGEPAFCGQDVKILVPSVSADALVYGG